MLTRRIVLGLPAALAAPPTITYAGTQTGLELILALDTSSSMFSEVSLYGGRQAIHFDIQKWGHATALRNPRVMQLLLLRKPHVRVVQWSVGAKDMFPEALAITDESSVMKLANFIDNVSSQGFEVSTVHSSVVEYVLSTPRIGETRTIDISTDEPVVTDDLTFCSQARVRAEKDGTTINVLSIGLANEEQKILDNYLRTESGFHIPIQEWKNYADAIQMKFELEIA